MKDPVNSLNISNKITKGMNELSNVANMLASNGSYDPILSEQFLQDIGFHSQESTTEELSEWIRSPNIYSQNLRRLSTYLENAVMQYGRSVSLLSDIKSYNYDLRCGTPDLADKIDSPEYKRSHQKALMTLRKLNIPYQIRRIDKKVAEEGVSFVWFSKHPDGIDLLDLPSNYCYITAPWTYGYLFAIDLAYFDRWAFNPQQIPELFEAYKTFCDMRRQLAATNGDKSKLVPYQYYLVSPFNGWCTVFDATRPIKCPPLIGGAQGALDTLSYRDLIKQKSLIDLWRVLAFKIPINATTGKMQITYKEACSIIDEIRAVLPDNFVAFSSPFDTESPINADQTTVLSNLQEVANNTFYDYSAIPNALFNTDLKSASALKLATNTLFAYASSGMYASVQNLVNWILRIECGADFDWHIVFHGNKLYEDEEREQAMKMLTSANAPVSYVMSHFGIEPFDLDNMFLIEQKSKIKEKLEPIPSANKTVTGEGSGRPKMPDSEKSESSDMVEDSGL